MQAKIEFDRQAAARREERRTKKSSHSQGLTPKHVRSSAKAAATQAVQKPTKTSLQHDPTELRSRLMTTVASAAPDHELRSRLMDLGGKRERKRSTEDLEGAISLASLGSSQSSTATYTVTAPLADHAAFAREILTDPSAPAISVSRQQGPYQPPPPPACYEPRHSSPHHQHETVVRQPAGHFIAVTGNGYY